MNKRFVEVLEDVLEAMPPVIRDSIGFNAADNRLHITACGEPNGSDRPQVDGVTLIDLGNNRWKILGQFKDEHETDLNTSKGRVFLRCVIIDSIFWLLEDLIDTDGVTILTEESEDENINLYGWRCGQSYMIKADERGNIFYWPDRKGTN